MLKKTRHLLAMFFVTIPPSLAAFGADNGSTLESIAQANTEAWRAIDSIASQYEVTGELIHDELMRKTAGTLRWMRDADCERLTATDIPRPGLVDDILVKGGVRHVLNYNKSVDLQQLTICDTRGVRASRSPALDQPFNDRCPEVLQYLSLKSERRRYTLQELMNAWDVAIEKRLVWDGDHIVVLLASYRTDSKNDEKAGSSMRIWVNQSKNHLVEKVHIIDTAVARKVGTNQFIPVSFSIEVLQFKDCGEGVLFPERIFVQSFAAAEPLDENCFFRATFVATQLDINHPEKLEDDLGFRYPKNAVVRDVDASGKADRYLLWGPDNQPSREFASADEFERFVSIECNVKSLLRHLGLSALVDRKQDSREPQ